ncbi:MAG TPA: nucleoside deaminase [Saprospiraceae bacterium]|nr:nucleoside deaminase [Saprospiraceae bacterium]HMP13249.1 nucleoside deaminase [Saprospiraceae bacterium]
MNDAYFMRETIRLSQEGMNKNAGGPFGAVIVKDQVIIGRGYNQVTSLHDPTAHAEINAIRDACRQIEHFSLENCVIYTSCEPCPMCLAAIYWARIRRIVYGNTRADAAAIDFDDDWIYREVSLPLPERFVPMEQVLASEAIQAFEAWRKKLDKMAY